MDTEIEKKLKKYIDNQTKNIILLPKLSAFKN